MLQIRAMRDDNQRLLLIGGGEITPDWIQYFAPSAYIVAVDGGLATCLDAGVMPDALIGDLDSVEKAHLDKARAHQVDIHAISEQDTTDFEKALRHFTAAQTESSDLPNHLVIGLGFLGKRFDHALASLHVLARYADRQIILLSPYDAVMLKTGSADFSVPVNTRFSIWPVEPVSFVRSDGLYWPLDGLRLATGHQIGTSNKTNSDRQKLVPQRPDDRYVIMVEAENWPGLLPPA